MEFEFTFLNEYSEEYSCYEEIYSSVAKEVFKHLNLKDLFIFEVDLIDDKLIHSINKKYRNIDRPTDVISFAFEDDINYKSLKFQPSIPRDIGEIFISVDTALRQAKEYNHSLKREMVFLFVHGLLHLLGYDHIEKEDEIIMFKIQDEIMDLLHL